MIMARTEQAIDDKVSGGSWSWVEILLAAIRKSTQVKPT